MDNEYRIPKALFNSKALFNPYQYEPFFKVMEWNDDNKSYEPNGKNVLITDEVGVGKTFEVGIILQEMMIDNPDLTVLIFCPVKLCTNWKEELRENFGFDAINYHDRKFFGQISIVPYSYFSSKKTNNISDEIKDEYSLMDSYNNEMDKNKIDEKLKGLPQYDVLILDEAHYIRNTGRLNSYINELVKEKERSSNKLKIFMTGTPIFNTKQDYDNIIQPLQNNFEITNTLQGEANCYDKILQIRLGGIDDDSTVGKEVHCSESEEKIIGKIEESNYGQQKGFLKRISSSSFYSLKKYIESPQKWQEKYYEDIYENNVYENNIYHDLKVCFEEWREDSKLIALKKLVRHLQQQEKTECFKVIIFSCFINTCEYLKSELEKESYHVYSILGKTSAKDIEKYKNLFKTCKEPAILICSDAAKEGHNLQFCQYIIHYDLPFSPAVIGQRNGRIYRKGQTGTPQVFYMLLDKGYDLRLFGEIIVEKCQIVKEASKEKGISIMNILPSDADKYVKKCVKEFINNYFENKKEEHKGNASKDEENINRKIAKEFLKKYFKKDGDWKYSEAEALFNNIEEKEDAQKEVIQLYNNINNDNENGTFLLEYYQLEYDKKIEEFIKKCFPEKTEDIKELKNTKSMTQIFKEYCEEFLKKKKDNRNTKYCQDMLTDDEKRTSLIEYKEQFEALLEWRE